MPTEEIVSSFVRVGMFLMFDDKKSECHNARELLSNNDISFEVIQCNNLSEVQLVVNKASYVGVQAEVLMKRIRYKGLEEIYEAIKNNEIHSSVTRNIGGE